MMCGRSLQCQISVTVRCEAVKFYTRDNKETLVRLRLFIAVPHPDLEHHTALCSDHVIFFDQSQTGRGIRILKTGMEFAGEKNFVLSLQGSIFNLF